MKKINPDFKEKGKLILVTAMTSNKYGIGKTTISIGLADAINQIGKSVCLALREPSMGPVFGIKGGATGGGLAKIEPSDEINLHFMGDFHAIAQANNLLASIIDNHIFQGNDLKIDTNKIFFKRCLDVNDRSLREIEYKIGNKNIKTGFNITAASEVMAVLSLSTSLQDLKNKLGNILVAMSEDGVPIFAKDLKAEEAMTILLKDAIKPNMVKTLEGTNALIHLGPFANIAHGCNSVVATQTALSMAEFCVTEAGFGTDLGAEKFLNIKTRVLNQTPNAVVLVVVVNVTKEHGNGDLVKGFENVKRHIHILKNEFKQNVVVAINKHSDDTEQDLSTLIKLCNQQNVEVCCVEAFSKGGKGCLELAKKVVEQSEKEKQMSYTYELADSIKTKIEKIVTRIYGAKSVKYSEKAEKQIELANSLKMDKFFVNIAKTQFSFTDNKNLLGAPQNFEFNIDDVEIRSGANMIVAIAGNMLLMPGLGKKSNYANMQIDSEGKIEGLF